MIKGIPASNGIGIGRALVYQEEDKSKEYTGKKIGETQLENEMTRFAEAVQIAGKKLEEAKVKASKILEEKDLQLFEAYMKVLGDPILNDMVRTNIQKQYLCAEASVLEAVDKIKAMFLTIDNDYMKQRAEDVENVGNYILDALLGRERVDLSQLEADTILIARDLTPADTVALDKARIKGFAIAKGGETSHTAIVARMLEIPAVVGCGENILKISSGETVILDGAEGTVLSNPDSEQLGFYMQEQQKYLAVQEEIGQLKEKPAVTIDGMRVELFGNIGKPEEALSVVEKGGQGIGLFRTEFLYMDRNQLPSEEEQFQAYKKAAESMGGMPCIIRTLDIGGDKQIKSLELPAEENPFLGYRAIRICLKEVEVFKTQLKAILRASTYGTLKIMFPMISGIEELRAAKKILAEVKNDLDEKSIPYDRNIQVGIMIEIPSAAITADILAKEADFFSIGTNDLCQYSLAVDRMNENVSYLYNPMHPGVLRLIKNVIEAGHEAGIKVGMCGEMASNVESAAVLLGLGLDEFSMAPSSIPYIKKAICNLTFEKAGDIAENVLKISDAAQIRIYVKERLNAD
ncbi:phosphoenolpyruvate--protein phosphotransferase [Ruminiclostridium cellobioparum]|uniref:Phosphoenolpyruvate-protein phosphotransferase n=1 Tax=Ruminiclostridium cellobioparum subsp. termitidis CT1112 TaxID=1195236 RepID=S0FWS0_RUMCE|nr:phosphoenolpyruvate--protein phosphotransferase [Ruminiclostridium cellobioparum]EMS73003.1 phosphoenolpyruvate-protein phosphotransferase [Ruminiclostridium cellobioparum subsp. termitidis CT1112]